MDGELKTLHSRHQSDAIVPLRYWKHVYSDDLKIKRKLQVQVEHFGKVEQ